MSRNLNELRDGTRGSSRRKTSQAGVSGSCSRAQRNEEGLKQSGGVSVERGDQRGLQRSDLAGLISQGKGFGLM